MTVQVLRNIQEDTLEYILEDALEYILESLNLHNIYWKIYWSAYRKTDRMKVNRNVDQEIGLLPTLFNIY